MHYAFFGSEEKCQRKAPSEPNCSRGGCGLGVASDQLWNAGWSTEGDSRSRQGRVRRLDAACPLAHAAFRTRATTLAPVGKRMDRLALLARELPLSAQLSAPF